MRNFQDGFETRKRSFINGFSICMAVPLINDRLTNENVQIHLLKMLFKM